MIRTIYNTIFYAASNIRVSNISVQTNQLLVQITCQTMYFLSKHNKIYFIIVFRQNVNKSSNALECELFVDGSFLTPSLSSALGCVLYRALCSSNRTPWRRTISHDFGFRFADFFISHLNIYSYENTKTL